MTRRRFFDSLASGQSVDLGEILMRWGTRVEGRVVDRGGRPVPGVHFRLLRTAQERFDPIAESRYAHLLSDAEDARQTIRGVVVDEAARPVARLRIAAEVAGSSVRSRADESGRFALFRTEPSGASGEEPLEIRLAEGLPEPWRLVRPVRSAWGEQAVQVVVTPAAQAILRPLDGRTGAPLADYELRFAAPYPETGRLTAYLPWMERLPSGETLVRHGDAAAWRR